MKLGLIVLADDNTELTAAITALQGLNGVTVEAVKASNKTAGEELTEELDLGASDLDEPAALHMPSKEELVAAMTKVRDEVGAPMLKEILTTYGATNLKTLDEADWPAAYAAAEEAVSGGEDDELGLDDDLDLDDGLGDGEDHDAEAVKAACQAHARGNGKEATTAILKANGLNTVRGLAKADQAVLNKIMAAVS